MLTCCNLHEFVGKNKTGCYTDLESTLALAQSEKDKFSYLQAILSICEMINVDIQQILSML